MPTKRAWTRGEKWLMATPLLFVTMGVGTWLWRKAMPITINVPETTYIDHLSFSPDSKRLAVSFRTEAGKPVPVQIFDLETNSKICELESPGASIFGVAWSPDGKRLVSGYYDGSEGPTAIPKPPRGDKKPAGFRFNKIGKIAIWDARSGQLTGSYTCGPENEDTSCYGMQFSMDGRKIINNGTPPSIYDAKTGKRLQVLKTIAAIRANERLGLWAQLDDKKERVQVVEMKTKRKVWESRYIPPSELLGPGAYEWIGDILQIMDVPTAPDAPYGLGILWDGKTRSVIQTPPSYQASNLSFNSDEKTLAFVNLQYTPPSPTTQSDYNSEIVVWDYRLNRELWRLPLESGGLVQWSPDGKWLSLQYESPRDSVTRLKIYGRNGNLHIERKIADASYTVWSPDSRQIAVANRRGDSSPKIYKVRVGE